MSRATHPTIRCAQPRHAVGRIHGFTLVELVVAITIGAIVVGFVVMFMTVPVDAYLDQSGRALLNDSSQSITRSMGEDLRSALPNSVRIRNAGALAVVELLRVEAVSFYRPDGALANPNRELDFSGANDLQFSAFGRLDPSAAANPYAVSGYFVVDHRGTGIAGYDAYQLTNVIVPAANAGIQRLASREEIVTFPAPGIRFAAPGDVRNRLYLISGPVAYICDSAVNVRTLRRYSNYPISPTTPTAETDAQLNGPGVINALLASNVATCQLTCRSGAAIDDICQDTLVLNLAVDRATPSGNETIRVFEQFAMP